MASDDAKVREAAERAAEEYANFGPSDFPPYGTDDISANLKDALSRQQQEIQQTLGAALGYPRYCDDKVNFPDATEADGVCVGDHVAESIAVEAAKRIADGAASLRELQAAAARSLAANAAWAKTRLTRELVTYPATSDAFSAAQREKDEADAALAALLPVPAEGAKGGG